MVSPMPSAGENRATGGLPLHPSSGGLLPTVPALGEGSRILKGSGGRRMSSAGTADVVAATVAARATPSREGRTLSPMSMGAVSLPSLSSAPGGGGGDGTQGLLGGTSESSVAQSVAAATPGLLVKASRGALLPPVCCMAGSSATPSSCLLPPHSSSTWGPARQSLRSGRTTSSRASTARRRPCLA